MLIYSRFSLFVLQYKNTEATLMFDRRPLPGLSSGGRYQNRKRTQIITIGILALIVGIIVFYFGGRQLKYLYYIKTGISNYNNGKISYASSDFNKATNLNPSGPLALDGLGLVSIKQNDYEKTEKYYTEAIAAGLKQNDFINHVKYGNQFLDIGAYKNAEIEFTHALQLNPAEVSAISGLGSCQFAYGNIDAAVAFYNKAIQYKPNLTKTKKLLEAAEDARNKGAIYYMFDKNGDPLARYNLINSKTKRTYILGPNAAHVVGCDVPGRKFSTGVDGAFSKMVPGIRIYLSIDTKVQQAIAKGLGWYRGSIVVLDPKTGDILGLYNQPTFNPNSLNADWWRIFENSNKPLLNRSIDKLYEPGSIAKVVTLGAIFDKNIPENKMFPVTCKGWTSLNGKTFYCWKKHGKVNTIERSIESSCNMGAAQMGYAVGASGLTEYGSRFGFGSTLNLGFKDFASGLNISIPVKTSTVPMDGGGNYNVAMQACGLGENYRITPLHAAMLAAACANSGIMMEPKLIKEIRNVEGTLIYKSEPTELKKSMLESSAKKIASIMVNTVENGIGKKARIRGVMVAGKTGTAGKSGELLAWFIAFAPADNPKYALSILGDGEGKGMDIAAPVCATVLNEILAP